MSYPPGSPDPDGSREPEDRSPVDPWATPATPPGEPGQQAGYPAYGPYQRPTNGKATAALWTGVASLVLVVCAGAGILGVVPIVLGVKARGEIRRAGGRQGGEGLALAGIITGAVAVVLSLAVIGLIVYGLSIGHTTFDERPSGV